VASFDQIAIFDLDGTLVDSVNQIAECLNRARVDFGFSPKPINYYKKLVGLPVYDLLSDIPVSGENLDKLIVRFRKYLTLDIQNGNNVLFPGVIEVLNLFLNMNIGLAIATSKPTEIAAEVVKHTMIKGFNVHVQGTDQFPPKPDPEVILRVLRLYPGVPSFMVGDRTEDVHAARSAKIPCIGIAAGAHSESELKEAGASLTFESFQDFYQNLINNDSFLGSLTFS